MGNQAIIHISGPFILQEIRLERKRSLRTLICPRNGKQTFAGSISLSEWDSDRGLKRIFSKEGNCYESLLQAGFASITMGEGTHSVMIYVGGRTRDALTKHVLVFSFPHQN